MRNKSTAGEAQRARILEALALRPHSSYELRKMGCYQCPTRIIELRRMGYSISTQRISIWDDEGYGCPTMREGIWRSCLKNDWMHWSSGSASRMRI